MAQHFGDWILSLSSGKTQSLKRCGLKYKQDSVLHKIRTMNNVQKHNIYNM
jgi:hypothetical protein